VAEFEIRDVESFEDIEKCVDLQRRTWGLPDVDITPSRLFVLARWTGTPPIGAFDPSGRLIAFLHTMLATFEGTTAYYSHMLAVDESLRDTGIGYALKLEQRSRALAAGVPLVVWTFDPLQSRNAYFNINKLGVVVRRYVENFYGDRHSSVFDAGIGSDRVFAEWWVASDRVGRVVGGQKPSATGLEPYVTIPSDFAAIKRVDSERALIWRLRTREQFQSRLSRGLAAVALVRDAESGSSRYAFEPADTLVEAIGDPRARR
jgi:predicted GNAT superfamily acetyltransferase